MEISIASTSFASFFHNNMINATQVNSGKLITQCKKRQQSKSWQKFTHTVTKEMFFAPTATPQLFDEVTSTFFSQSVRDWFHFQPLVEKSALSVLCVLGRQLDILLSSSGSNCRQLGSAPACDAQCRVRANTLLYPVSLLSGC